MAQAMNFLLPVEIGRRELGRFAVIDPGRLDSAVEGALDRLRQEHLLASIADNARLRIVGGLAEKRVGDMSVYSHAFVISQEDDGSYSGGVAGPGNRCQRIAARTLGEVVDFVVEMYRRRSASTR